MKRPDAAVPVTGMIGLVRDDRASKTYPRLVEFLSDTQWDDGKPRQPGSLTFFIEDGIWKACLNDRENDASLYVSGDAQAACMASLEKRLDGSVPAEWRAWKKKGRKA